MRDMPLPAPPTLALKLLAHWGDPAEFSLMTNGLVFEDVIMLVPTVTLPLNCPVM